MKSFFFAFILLILGLNTFSQVFNIKDLTVKDSIYYNQNIIYTGTFISYHKNDIIKEKGFIKKGKLDSTLTSYDKSGNPLSVLIFKGEKLVHQTLYYPNTNTIKRKTSLKNKIEDGLCTTYYLNGSPQDSGCYALGKKIGKWTYWNKYGQKNLEITIHKDCWKKTEFVISKDSIYSKTDFFDKFGRKIVKNESTDSTR